MKKIVLSVMSALFVFMMSVHTNFALTADESYNLARQYWNSVTQLESADEVMTYASLGLDASQKKLGEYVVSDDYASSVAKTVIALTLHGDDPRNYNNVNYVDMLESYVHDNGAFDKNNDSTFANYQVYGVYALYVVHSSKTELAADYLAQLASSTGAFGSAYGESSDITGWVVEALTLVNQAKYQTTIDNAIAYLQAHQNSDAGYDDGYGVNVNTQACVLMGLFTYNADGVKGNTYNQGNNNPYDVVLNYQNSDGSFWYNQAGEDNYYATLQGAQVVGYYANGSVYKTAFNMYQTLLTGHDDEVVEEKPEIKDEDNTEVKNTDEAIQPKEEKQEIVSQKKVVNTADESPILLLSSLMLISGYILIKGRKSIG